MAELLGLIAALIRAAATVMFTMPEAPFILWHETEGDTPQALKRRRVFALIWAAVLVVPLIGLGIYLSFD